MGVRRARIGRRAMCVRVSAYVQSCAGWEIEKFSLLCARHVELNQTSFFFVQFSLNDFSSHRKSVGPT